MPIHAVGTAIVNIVNGKKWNLDLVPDLSVLGFTGGYSPYQFRYCFLFMLVYVGCNAIYVAGLRFIPNSIARKGFIEVVRNFFIKTSLNNLQNNLK